MKHYDYLDKLSVWECGEFRRIYINTRDVIPFLQTLGFEIETYKTGNVSRASYRGEKISNTKARKVINAVDGCYVDLVRDRVVSSRITGNIRFADFETLIAGLID